MGDRLRDRVAVVTGAGGGIGRGIALALAAEGAKVVVNDLGCDTNGTGTSSTPADNVVAEIRQRGGEVAASYDSVATPEGGINIINTAIEKFGGIDILVNNAVAGRSSLIFDMSPEIWEEMIRVTLSGYFFCTQPAAIFMRQQRSGRIINMTSGAAFMGYPGGAHYSAAKGGVMGFTRTLALEVGRYGITANAIAPAAFTKAAAARRQAEAEMGLPISVAPQMEKLAPEDVAPIVVYLATDAAADINGNIFGAMGGQISLYTYPTPVKSIHKNGRWTLDELQEIMPATLAIGMVNPAPPESSEPS